MRGVAHVDVCDVIGRFDQQDFALGQLAHGADGFGVPGMADHDHLQASLGMALGFDVDLADQRAGGIDIDHLAAFGGGWDRLGDAVGGKDHWAVVGAFVQFFDEHRPLVA